MLAVLENLAEFVVLEAMPSFYVLRSPSDAEVRPRVHESSVANAKILEQSVNENANPPFSNEQRSDARRLISSEHQVVETITET